MVNSLIWQECSPDKGTYIEIEKRKPGHSVRQRLLLAGKPNSIWALPAYSRLNFSLLSHLQSIIDLDAKISDGACELSMSIKSITDQ
jgi:hypothetical protein